MILEHINSVKRVLQTQLKSPYPTQYLFSSTATDADDDDVTVVTSNTSLPRPAVEHHALGMMINPSHAIADTGATSLFLTKGAPCLNKRRTQTPISVTLPDGRKITSSHICDVRIPGFMDPTLTRIGAAALALGLMSAGAGMELKALNQGKLLGGLVLMLKHLILPCLAWGLAQLFELNLLQTTVLLIFSGLPTASSCYVLAARMGYNGPYVAGLVTLSTLLGMVSLPFALGVLRDLRF